MPRWLLTIVVLSAAAVAGLACCSSNIATLEDGGDGGGAKDGGANDGGLCDWRGNDAGFCTEDSQCQSGYYCQVTKTTACFVDGGGTVFADQFVVAGSCLPICDNTSSCETDQDCSEGLSCFSWKGPSVDRCDPICADGGLCRLAILPPPSDCPTSCTMVELHHGEGILCTCPGVTCDAGM